MNINNNLFKFTKKINYLKDIPHILWINLDRSKDRYDYILNLFKNNNIKNHTRISAVDGNHISTEEINHQVGKYVYATLKSHLKAIKYYVDNRNTIGDMCMIVEDDISFDYTKYWNKSFSEYFKDFPNDWEIIKLFNNYETVGHILKEIKISNLKDHKNYGANCYIIKYESAIKILNEYNNSYKSKYPHYFVSDRGMIHICNTYSLPLFTFRDDNDSNIIQSKQWLESINNIKKAIEELWINESKKNNILL
jgi:hypothetical protein